MHNVKLEFSKNQLESYPVKPKSTAIYYTMFIPFCN